MKTLITILLISISSLFSKEIVMRVTFQGHDINHTIKSGEVFTVNGIENKIHQLKFFLSDFVIHDYMGNDIPTPKKYQLIDIDSNNYHLGNVDLDRFYSVSFKFGVDSATNHSDPTIWPMGHPLNLSYSSMHWGWAHGYRFIALEGYTKDIYDRWLNNYQYHLLGNQYYSSHQLSFSPSDINDTIYFEVVVDLPALYANVNLTKDNIVHGSGGANDIIANNINSREVIISYPLSVEDRYPELNVSPNPAKDHFYINYENTNIQNLVFNLVDLNGNLVKNIFPLQSNKVDISNLSSGVYLLNIVENGSVAKTIKIIK